MSHVSSINFCGFLFLCLNLWAIGIDSDYDCEVWIQLSSFLNNCPLVPKLSIEYSCFPGNFWWYLWKSLPLKVFVFVCAYSKTFCMFLWSACWLSTQPYCFNNASFRMYFMCDGNRLSPLVALFVCLFAVFLRSRL